MNNCFQRNLDFANRGLKDAQFIYTAEICKNILIDQPNCIQARKILQTVSKSIYENKIWITKILAQVMSIVYLFLSILVCKHNKLKMVQQSVCYYPKGKLSLILLAQAALDEDLLEVLLFAYEEMKALFPEEAKFALALGNVYISMGNYQKSLEIGHQILEKDASNIEAMDLIEQAVLARMQIQLQTNLPENK